MYQGMRNLRGGGGESHMKWPGMLIILLRNLFIQEFPPPPSFGEKGAEILGLGGNSSHCN